MIGSSEKGYFRETDERGLAYKRGTRQGASSYSEIEFQIGLTRGGRRTATRIIFKDLGASKRHNKGAFGPLVFIQAKKEKEEKAARGQSFLLLLLRHT